MWETILLPGPGLSGGWGTPGLCHKGQHLQHPRSMSWFSYRGFQKPRTHLLSNLTPPLDHQFAGQWPLLLASRASTKQARHPPLFHGLTKSRKSSPPLQEMFMQTWHQLHAPRAQAISALFSRTFLLLMSLGKSTPISPLLLLCISTASGADSLSGKGYK